MRLYSYTVYYYGGTNDVGYIIAENKNSAITCLEGSLGLDNYGIFVKEISEIDGYKIILQKD